MSIGRAVPAAFLGGLLAAVFVLAWRASKQTGKSIPASIPDVPAEAQRLAADVRHRAAEAADDVRHRAATATDDVKSRATAVAEEMKSLATEAVSTGWEAIRDKEVALKDRIIGHGAAEEAGAAEVAGQL